MSLRKIIDKIIKEELQFNEAEVTTHFIDRVKDRIESEYTTVSKEPEDIKNVIKRNINLIKKVNFPDNMYHIAVEIFSSDKTFFYKKPTPEKIEQSKGKKIWAIVRNNVIETLMLNSNFPQNTKNFIKVDKLRYYIETEKNGDFNLTPQDIKNIEREDVKIEKQQDATKKTLNIDGVNWIVDAESETIYKKNKPEIKYPAFDFAENLESEGKSEKSEEILSFLISENLKILMRLIKG